MFFPSSRKKERNLKAVEGKFPIAHPPPLLVPRSPPLLPLQPIPPSTAALKAVVAECKPGAKLVDIANKGDALMEE